LPRRQMLVNASARVVKLDVPQRRRELREMLVGRALLRHDEMADVDRGQKVVPAQAAAELAIAVERVDEHAGLGLERDGDADRARVVQEPRKTLEEPAEGGGRVIFRSPAPD